MEIAGEDIRRRERLRRRRMRGGRGRQPAAEAEGRRRGREWRAMEEAMDWGFGFRGGKFSAGRIKIKQLCKFISSFFMTKVPLRVEHNYWELRW